MNKDEVLKLANECGLFVIEADNDGIIVEGRDSDPKGLLAFAKACEKAGMEKAAKICHARYTMHHRLGCLRCREDAEDLRCEEAILKEIA